MTPRIGVHFACLASLVLLGALTTGISQCQRSDEDNDDWTVDQGDCNDHDASVHPDAPEICDFKDNDCDGMLDEELGELCRHDDDYDGDGVTYDNGDCDDWNAAIFPGALELCDQRDNNCDGVIDEGFTSSCALNADVDGDGYTTVQQDCNDNDPSIHPEAVERCDQLDNDCDNEIDEEVEGGCTYDEDLDQDGWSINAGDCNDADHTIHPGALEVCDQKDNDCDGVIGELEDNDTDGFVTCTGDCDPARGDVSPAAQELWYDGTDSDCNGEEDPKGCDDPPAPRVIEQLEGCDQDLELRLLDLCEGDCSTGLSAVIDVFNRGHVDSPNGLEVAIFGITTEGQYQLLGKETLGPIPAGGSSGGVFIPLPTFADLYFYPTVVLSIDDNGAGGQILDECNEDNNRDTLFRNSLECPAPDACEIDPPGYPVDSDETCSYSPPVGEFEPVVEWQKSSFTVASGYNQIMMMPVVGNLTDDNGDGRIDASDVADIAFTTFTGGAYTSTGYLRAISGDDGRELFSVSGPNGTAGVTLADADNNGTPEVYSVNTSGDLMAYTNKGVYLWTCDTTGDYYSSPSVADMDGDGDGEILVGSTVCSHTGTKLFTTTLTHNNRLSFFQDMDQDGKMEIVSGAGVSRSDGTTLMSAHCGYSAVADFDHDGGPELVTVCSSTVRLYKMNATQVWSVSVPGGGGGAPTVADFDGDGAPEIGVAGAYYYTVFETNGTVKWSKAVQDYSSSQTGSSVYDFDGDGKAEVVYADELALWVYDGSTGNVLLQQSSHGSGTLLEYPVIADVDRDGHVEIVLASNNYAFSGWTGITVLGDINNNWVTGRPVWNQHAYHITNVDDDLGIPARQEANWLTGNNTFRQGGFGNRGALAAPDLVPVLVKVCGEDCSSSSRILFQIENRGANTVEAGLPFAVYGEDSSGERHLVTSGQVDTSIPAGFSSDSQEVVIDATQTTGYLALWLVADDDGTGQGSQNECRESNNGLELPQLCK